MTDAILKGVSAILLVAVVFLSGMCWVNVRTINDLSARNEGLSAALKAIDLKAKADEKTYKENLNAIQDKSNRDRAAVDEYYRRLLQGQNRAGASTPPQNPPEVDAGASKSAITGCDIEIEKRCVNDALTVEAVAEFFRVNKFPLAD